MSGAARRLRNPGTGYPYGPGDHCQRWRMPDGTEEFTGWIAPGDTAPADLHIAHREETIRRCLDDIAKWRAIRAALAAEAAGG
ncbi:hypothetical protein QEH44_gp58 [Arthrobacter phage Shambre1]|uniref:Uncharacterized protein n=1 Tax=Arthrobacter phage Shambre1 TaxID=2927284 RepID=A0A977KNL8_9CAUD|nr:hypothetical protein QEH44_gp58 [Arthrobacter phage Shambre1]UXE04794.1 hypothetical protein SEA_SHAMBRE1_58 [Arthrobacter phage Shambre1]